MVALEIETVTSASTVSTALAPPPSRSTPAAGPMMVVDAEVLVRTKPFAPTTPIVWRVANTLELNVIVVGVVLALAVLIAPRRLIKPLGGLVAPLGELTTIVLNSCRGS